MLFLMLSTFRSAFVAYFGARHAKLRNRLRFAAHLLRAFDTRPDAFAAKKNAVLHAGHTFAFLGTLPACRFTSLASCDASAVIVSDCRHVFLYAEDVAFSPSPTPPYLTNQSEGGAFTSANANIRRWRGG